jgi:Spy/CpxP family protein refolding chaperone
MMKLMNTIYNVLTPKTAQYSTEIQEKQQNYNCQTRRNNEPRAEHHET